MGSLAAEAIGRRCGSAVSAYCPNCGTFQLFGVLRCRRCGAFTRGWAPRPQGAGDTFELGSIRTLEQARILRQTYELEFLAPEVLKWMEAHPNERAKLLELLVALYGPGAKR
jgi:hypothetical protein